jgi:hypothetical protein
MPTNKYRVPVILDSFGERAKQRAAAEGCSLSEYIRRLVYFDLQYNDTGKHVRICDECRKCIQNSSAGSSSINSSFENKKTNTV